LAHITRRVSGSSQQLISILVPRRGGKTIVIGATAMFDILVKRIISAAFFSVMLFSPLAMAQAQQTGAKRVLPAPVVAMIDFKRAVEDSTAGRSVIRQINERHAKIQKEIAKDTAVLESTKQELERQRALLAPDIFKQKWRNFQVKVQQYRKSIQGEQRRLDAMLGQGILKVEAKLVVVLRDIANELGANIVIDAGPGRGSVLFSDSQLVITQEATDRLNQVLPDVKVQEPVADNKAPAQKPRLQVPKVQ
jgi:Skp family chaperone for outer membrane proteins